MFLLIFLLFPDKLNPRTTLEESPSNILVTHRRTRNIVESLLTRKGSSTDWTTPKTGRHNPLYMPQVRKTTFSNTDGSDSIRERYINVSQGETVFDDHWMEDEDDDGMIREPLALPQRMMPDDIKNTNSPFKISKEEAAINTEMFVHQHEKVTLRCEVNINFTNNIWLKDGEVVDSVIITGPASSGHRYTRDRTGRLYINNVRLEDNGQWQCEAEDAYGFVMTAKPIHLTILGKFRGKL